MPVKRYIVEKIYDNPKDFTKTVIFNKNKSLPFDYDYPIYKGDYLFFNENDYYVGHCSSDKYTFTHFKKNIESRVLRLVHFTDERNLESIKSNGLCSNLILKKKKIVYSYNDDHRMDGIDDGVCFTVNEANFMLLNAYSYKNPQRKYVLLYIKPDILFDLFPDVPKFRVYYNHNAASRYVEKSITDIEIMFQDSLSISTYNKHMNDWITTHYTREYKNPFQTTSPQAEVIIFDNIPSKYIYLDQEFKKCIKEI